jgi:anti-anti-sigma regulatory factor
MKYVLIVAKGSKQGMTIPIKVDLFLIGSDRMCQLRKGKLGSKHCALMMREDKVFIRDMDSGQTTLVNGAVLPAGTEWPLHDGDRIGVGSLEFQIQFVEESLSGKDLEEWALRCLDVRTGPEREDDDSTAPAQTRTAASAAAAIINQLEAMKGLVKGRLRVGVEQGITVVQFNDDILVEEAEISLIRKELGDNLNKPNMRVLLDLKNVRKLSTSAVMMLFEVHRWLRHRGSAMAFCRIRAELEPALSMLEVENVPRFPDRSSALHVKW